MAKYDLYKVHGIDNKDEEDKYGARIVPEGTISKERLYKWVEKTCGFNRGQADAIMTCITDAVIEYLRDGYIVQLGELGYLSVTVSGRAVKDKKEIRSGSVHFKNVNLRISSSLRKEMCSMPLERVEVSNVSRLTHILKNKAISDLNQFVADGWLTKYGAGRTVVYLLVR